MFVLHTVNLYICVFRLVPYPTVIMTHLWIYRVYVCHVITYASSNSHPQTPPHN